MGIVQDALARAIGAEPLGRPAPQSFTAQVRAIGGRGPGAAQRLSERFGVTPRTARGWLAGAPANKANRSKVQAETDERAERRQVARARRAAASVRIDTRARFGYTAPAGTTDDPRERLITATIPPHLADQLFDAYQADDENAMREILAEGVGQSYFRESGNRADGLRVEFTDITYMDMEI